MSSPEPPAAVIVMLPLLFPLQLISVFVSFEIEIAGGSVTTRLLLITGPQKLASVILTVYVLAGRFGKKPEPLLSPPGIKVYTNAPVPPEAVTVTLPVLAPLQLAFADDSLVIEIAIGCERAKEVSMVQLALSFMVRRYVPSARPVWSSCPLTDPDPVPSVQVKV